MTFGVTPVAASTAVGTAVPGFIQWQDNAANVGTPSVVTVNIESPLIATRGVGEQRNVITISVDACIGGPTWTLLTSGLPPSSQSPYPVTWSPSGVGWTGTNWIAMGYQPGNANEIYIMTSPDRINWTVRLNASTGGYGPSFGAFLGNFAVCGLSTTYSFYTANGGATWQGTTPTPLDFTANTPISAGNGVFCGMRGSYTSVCAFNTNTLAVTYTTLPAGVNAYGVVFDGINHIACGGTALSAHSPDGVTWTAGTQAPGGFLTGAGNGAGIAIICDYVGNVSRTTDSGVTWTLVPGNPLGGGGAWNSFYAEFEFIVITVGGYVYTSPDGLTWTPSSGTKNLPFIASTTRWYAAYGAQGRYLAFPEGPFVPSNDYAIGQC